MDISTIVRLLTNAGFTVKGVNRAGTHLLIEDPSCILRSFETFLDYAWVIVSLIAAILLFGWAISKIRGASTDITTNIRNLVIMFGVLAVAKPIVNVIYGDDLMARTCHIVEVPLSDVQKILDARNAQLSKNDSLFEGIDIFDSGIRSSDVQSQDLPSVDVPEFSFPKDPDTGEITVVCTTCEEGSGVPATEPVTQSTPDTNPVSTPPITVSNVKNNSTSNATAPMTARVISTNVIEYARADGSAYRHNNGTPAWRHTNPGNIINSRFTEQHGAIGRGKKFAIFPSRDVGMQAIVSLLRSSSYNSLSIINAIKKYAPAADNNDPVSYAQTISRKTGLDVNRKLNTLSDAEIQKVADIIQQVEGWRPGTVTNR